MDTYTVVYFGAVIVAMAMTPLVSQWAKRHSLLDEPGLRKVHRCAIPRVGGIVFVVSTLCLVLPVFFLDNAIGQSFREARTELLVLLAAACFVFVVGFIDDLTSVPGHIKLLCLIGASLAVCASGTTLHLISVRTWFEFSTGWLAWPLTVAWIVMITVCVNLIDGLDGLAAGVALIVCATIALLAFWSDYSAMVVLMLALLGSVTGFLFFNFHPAKIFMGDGGSMFLGFVIGAGSAVCQSKTCALVGLTLPFLVLGVPILDTTIAVLRRRVLERRSVFAPDRNHLHHRLLSIGLKQRSVAIAIYAVTAICASIGVFMLTVDGGWSVVLFAGGLLFLLFMFACLQGRRYLDILLTMRRNWAMAREAGIEKRNFENAQLHMREAMSLPAWWQTVCNMAKQMHFRSIGLWRRSDGHYADVYVWNATKDKLASDREAEIKLPIGDNGAASWEIRASIDVDSCLEISGRQAMLLARLIDEFPPPQAEENGKESDVSGTPGSGNSSTPNRKASDADTVQ